MVSEEKTQELVGLVKQSFQDWAGFSDPRFVDEEITYKRQAVERAHEVLGREALQGLLDEGQYDENRN